MKVPLFLCLKLSEPVIVCWCRNGSKVDIWVGCKVPIVLLFIIGCENLLQVGWLSVCREKSKVKNQKEPNFYFFTSRKVMLGTKEDCLRQDVVKGNHAQFQLLSGC